MIWLSEITNRHGLKINDQSYKVTLFKDTLNHLP